MSAKQLKALGKMFFVLIFMLAFSINTLAYDEFAVLKGEKKDITLEEATKYMLETSSGAINAKINLEKGDLNVRTTSDQIDKLNELEGVSIMFGLEHDSLNAILAEIRYDFAKEQKEKNYEAEINKLKYELRKKYFTVLQLEDVYNIKKDSLKLQEDSYKELEKKYELGVINQLDLENGKLNVVNAQLGVLEAEKNLTLTKMDLNTFLGYPLYTNLNPTDKLEMLTLSNVGIEAAIEAALTNNNNIRMLDYVDKLQNRIMDSMHLRYSPSSAKYMEQENFVKDSKNKLLEAKAGMEMDVNNKYMNMFVTYYAVSNAKKDLEYAIRQKEAAKLSYELGLSTYNDVEKADANLESKRIALSDNIFKYNLAVDDYELVRGVGLTTVPLGGE